MQYFFVLFGSLKTTDIFIPSMKFSFNYHQQYFIYTFLRKLRSNIYLNKKLPKKMNSRFSRKFSVKVDGHGLTYLGVKSDL